MLEETDYESTTTSEYWSDGMYYGEVAVNKSYIAYKLGYILYQILQKFGELR